MIDHSSRGSGNVTRERILEIAEQLFHERGYGATGVATVLRAAGVRSGSLYHFFRGKEALLLGVLERHQALLRTRVFEPVEKATDDPRERVFALLQLYMRNLESSGFTLGCPVGSLALEVADTIPKARVAIDRYFATWSREVQKWLEAAGSRLPVGADRPALARMALAVMEGGVMQAKAHRELGPFAAAVGQFRSYFEALEARARGEHEEEGQSPSGQGQHPDPTRRGANGSAWRTW